MKGILKQMLRGYRRLHVMAESRFDRQYFSEDVQAPRWVGHSDWQNHLYSQFGRKGIRVLEIGSREVTGGSEARARFSPAEYIGFDYYAGPNVDVVGDAHKLSTYFSGQKFDLIYSSAVFEHFAMPWVVATQISKLLKLGGMVFVETHFSFSSHERPWHFFQFSDMALRALFSDAMGFECVDSGMSNPIVGRFSAMADARLRNKPVGNLYCHSEYLGRKVREVQDFDWSTVDLGRVVSETVYPNGGSHV